MNTVLEHMHGKVDRYLCDHPTSAVLYSCREVTPYMYHLPEKEHLFQIVTP